MLAKAKVWLKWNQPLRENKYQVRHLIMATEQALNGCMQSSVAPLALSEQESHAWN
jgi:hypothetical protein